MSSSPPGSAEERCVPAVPYPEIEAIVKTRPRRRELSAGRPVRRTVRQPDGLGAHRQRLVVRRSASPDAWHA